MSQEAKWQDSRTVLRTGAVSAVNLRRSNVKRLTRSVCTADSLAVIVDRVVPYGTENFDSTLARELRKPAGVVRPSPPNPGGRPLGLKVAARDEQGLTSPFPLDERAIAIGLRDGQRPLPRDGRLSRLMLRWFGVGHPPVKLADKSLEALRHIGVQACRPGFDLDRESLRLRDLGFSLDRLANVGRYIERWAPFTGKRA